MIQKFNIDKLDVNPNSMNFVFSQLLFMKYRLEYLNSPLLNIAFLSLLVYLILPDKYNATHEARNIILSGLISSILI